jgi:hypothetical protein
MYSRTIGMPTYGYAASALTRLRQRQEDREPRDHQAAGILPSGDSWRFTRRVGNGARCAAAGAVHLARIAPSPSLRLVTESTSLSHRFSVARSSSITARALAVSGIAACTSVSTAAQRSSSRPYRGEPAAVAAVTHASAIERSRERVPRTSFTGSGQLYVTVGELHRLQRRLDRRIRRDKRQDVPIPNSGIELRTGHE